MNLDLINAVFVVGGCVAAFQNVVTTHKSKSVVGVSLPGTMWFITWGIWNVYYFKNLAQNISFYAGIVIVLINLVWLGQMIYYNFCKKRIIHGTRRSTTSSKAEEARTPGEC